jgi:hypothetical protein
MDGRASRQQGTVYLARPGKTDEGWSASLGHVAPGVLFVFSTNAAPFEGPRGDKPGTGYSPFAIYALLEHRGDFKAAARTLGEAGYGRPTDTAPDDHWDGMRTLPLRPYRGYQGLRLKGVHHG